MARIIFYLQSKKSPAGIYVRLRQGAEIDAKAKTKLAINPEDWSAAKGQPKNLKDESFKRINSELNKLRMALLAHYNDSVNKVAISSGWLKNFITPPEEIAAVPNKLLDYFEYYLVHKENSVKGSTNSKIRVIQRLLERFQRETKKEYFISDVSPDFKLTFEKYCLSDGYSHGTIVRALKYIKTMCNHAKRNGISVNRLLDEVSIKPAKREKPIFLNIEELALIEKAKLDDKDYLLNARDWLIISCYTGQRVSDFMNLNKDQIRYENKRPIIEFTQKKGNKRIALAIHPIVIKYLAKNDGDFPRPISDQKYNEYIKEVCKLSEIKQKISGSIKDKKTNRNIEGEYEKWQLVTSHIGRRSFATNFYSHIPTPLLMAATGHATEKQFLEYIGKIDVSSAIHLANIFNKTLI